MNDEIRYRVLKLLRENPNISQRALAQELDISLGKVNYCLKALVLKGLLKVKNFKESNNKTAYAYILTSKGLEEKARVTVRFLRRKIKEYERLEQEIEVLREEVGGLLGINKIGLENNE